MPRYPGFIGGSGTSQSLIANAEDTINLYVERAQSAGAQNPAGALLPTPGFQTWTLSSAPDAGGRALLYANGRLFGVSGAGFYEYDTNGTPTRRGGVAVDGNPAQLVFNGVVGGQIGICSGGNVYCFTLSSNAFSQVLTGEATMIAYAAGFGFAFNLTTGKVRESALNDLSTWPSAQFFQRSLFADPWQTMFVDANNLLWLIGTDSFEAWYNTGVGTQPWAPLSGLNGRYGIAAPFAFCQTGTGRFWLARNPEGVGQLVFTTGGAPQAASNFAFDTAVATYLRTARIDDAELLPYQQEGHTFVTAHFPSVPASWTYDVEGQSWAKRGKFNTKTGMYDLWAPRAHAFAFGKHLIAERTTGNLFWMDTAFATEIDGTGIRRLRRASHLNVEHQRIPIDDFELLMDVGLGLATGQGSDPKAMLRVSVDGGRTWGNERQAGVGRIGNYRKRVYWNRIGAPADAVFEVAYSEPTPFRIVDAYLNNFEGRAA